MPASGTGIFKKLFRKDKKPLNTQRVVISDTQKFGLQGEAHDISNKRSNLEPVDFTNLYEEPFLEETPIEGVIFDKSDVQRKHRGNNKDILAEKPVFDVSQEKRFKKRKKGVFNLFSAIPLIFKKKSRTSNSSALEFAESRKRLGKKGRRNRRVLIYAGTGIVVVVLTLAIVFVPGEAAPTTIQTPGISQPSASGTYIVSNVTASDTTETPDNTVSGNPSDLPSVSPTPTQTTIETTPPDIFVPIIDIDEEVKTFMVKADKYYNDIGYSNNHYKYTPEEVTILAKVIYGEARSEDEKGKIAVGNVVMNRVLNPSKFGNTITAVVTKSQFTGYNPDCTTTGPVYRKCLQAAWAVLDYEVWVIPQDIYYYQRAQVEYFYGTFYKKIGDHCFYRTALFGRSRNKDVPPRLFERTFQWPTVGCKPEERVKKLQYMLNKLGYSKVKPDKYFGQDTKDALKDFQKKHGLYADGIAGEKTLKELIKEFGEENYYEAFYEK